MRGEAARVTDLRPSAVGRRLNLPPSYVLIHRVSTASIGVLCQLECEGPFRGEVLQWMPGYLDAGEGLEDALLEDLDGELLGEHAGQDGRVASETAGS
jgi:hypothetical protein